VFFGLPCFVKTCTRGQNGSRFSNLSEQMGLDSNLFPAGAQTPVSAASDDAPPARAITASMQNLLAQYFADQRQAEAASSPVHDHQAKLAAALTPAPTPAESAADSLWPQSARDAVAHLQAEIVELRAQLERQNQLLQNAQAQADHDVLTPTLNRRAFLREATRAMADCKRYGEEATLIYVDMDNFKAVNDAYGHAAGDAALIYVAETLNANVREGDSVGRMGGDEFAVLLRHADLQSARVKAMKLEAELMMGTFEHNGLYLKTGGSFGVRGFAGQASAEAWLSEADAAMFLVKKSSR
jgi:diguanylate cyclase (GGDEF)-like protein